MGRKSPRWTIAFSRALERSGEVEVAARDAGIDKSTAYLRRKTHSEFAEAWENALRLRSGRAEEKVVERVRFWERVKKGGLSAVGAADPSTISSSGNGPPPNRVCDREELLATTALGGQVKRVGPGRWTKDAEARFFDELAAAANVKRAWAAGGSVPTPSVRGG